MKAGIIIVLLLISLSCDYITNTKVIIINHSSKKFIATAYNGDIQIERYNDENDAVSYDNSKLEIKDNSIVIFEDVSDFGPSTPYDPWKRYNGIKLQSEGQKNIRILDKKDCSIYRKDKFNIIYLLEIK